MFTDNARPEKTRRTRSWSPPLIHRLHGGSQDENADLVVDEPESILCQDDDEEELVTRKWYWS
jgi:hypothetical protein